MDIDKKRAKELAQQFHANMTACINTARTAKVMHRAGIVEDAVMNAEDALSYAMSGVEDVFKLHDVLAGRIPEADAETDAEAVEANE